MIILTGFENLCLFLIIMLNTLKCIPRCIDININPQYADSICILLAVAIYLRCRKVNECLEIITPLTIEHSNEISTSTTSMFLKILIGVCRQPIKFCVNNNPSSNNRIVDCDAIKQVFCPQILSITGLKLRPSFDIFVSSVRQSFATLNTTFCAGCHHS